MLCHLIFRWTCCCLFTKSTGTTSHDMIFAGAAFKTKLRHSFCFYETLYETLYMRLGRSSFVGVYLFLIRWGLFLLHGCEHITLPCLS